MKSVKHLLRLRSEFLLPLIICLSVSLSPGQNYVNSTPGTVPFGSNNSYSGTYILPSNAMDSHAQSAYNSWVDTYVLSCGGNPARFRVKFDNANETVSEGIAYGMLLSAYASDKTRFDGFWAYYKAYRNANGLMNWWISGCSNTVLGQNGATDADEDAAMALMVANHQWPNTTTPHNYAQDLSDLISKVRQYEIQSTSSPGPYQPNNGDGWGQSNTCRNPSYMAPAWYQAYGCYTGDTVFWNNVISASHTLILANRHSSTGLVSNWSNHAGTPNTCNGGIIEYGFDACRNPWRYAIASAWWGDATANSHCNMVAAYLQTVGVSNWKGPLPMSGGTGTWHNPSFVATWAAGLVGTNPSYQSLLNAAYTETVNTTDPPQYYYGNTLRVLSLFLQTGNFWNPCSLAPIPQADLEMFNFNVSPTSTQIGGTINCTGNLMNSGNANPGSISNLRIYLSTDTIPDQGDVILGTIQTPNLNPNAQFPFNQNYTIPGNITCGPYYVIGVGDDDAQINESNESNNIGYVPLSIGVSAPSSISGPASICPGNSATLTAQGIPSGANVSWFLSSCGGSQIGSGTSISVSPASTSTYYVQYTLNGCQSTCVSHTLNVGTQSPPSSVSANPSNPCGGQQVVLSASGGSGNYVWYAGGCGQGAPVGTGSSVTVNPTTNTTYYVRSESGSCTSPCNSVTVTIGGSISPPTLGSSSSVVCGGNNVTLYASAGNGTVYWYASGCATSVIGTGTSLTQQVFNTTTYYARVQSGGCWSTCSSITIQAYYPPGPTSVSASFNPICPGFCTDLVAVGGSGTIYWYDDFGQPLGFPGPFLTVCPPQTSTFHAYSWYNGCWSQPSSITIQVGVDPPGGGVLASPSQICLGDPVNLSVAGGGSNTVWYRGQCGFGPPVGYGAAITVYPTFTTTYYARNEDNGCASICRNSTPIQVDICTGLDDEVMVARFDLVQDHDQLKIIPPDATVRYSWTFSSIDGKVLSRSDGFNSTHATIDLNGVSQGIYYVKIETAKDQIVKKVLVWK